MKANEFGMLMDFESNLTLRQEVLVKWTAGSAGHFQGRAAVKKINRASVRVILLEDVPTVEWGTYTAGREIVVPLFRDSGMKTWAHFNRVEPIGGYK